MTFVLKKTSDKIHLNETNRNEYTQIDARNEIDPLEIRLLDRPIPRFVNSQNILGLLTFVQVLLHSVHDRLQCKEIQCFNLAQNKLQKIKWFTAQTIGA